MKSAQKEVICSTKAPLPIGSYSQAVKVSDFIFISGQLPLEPQTGKIISDDITEQTKRCMENLTEILNETGNTMENVVKTTIYLKEISDFAAVNKVYQTYFKSDFPARATLQVSALAGKAKVEIDAIAFCN